MQERIPSKNPHCAPTLATSFRLPATSQGHVCWSDDGARELIHFRGELYIAQVDRPLDLHGYRQGSRWECPDRPSMRDALAKYWGFSKATDPDRVPWYGS